MERRERKTMLTAHAPIQHIKTGKHIKEIKNWKEMKEMTNRQLKEIKREPVQYYKKTQQLKKEKNYGSF